MTQVKDKVDCKDYANESEIDGRNGLVNLLKNNPIPEDQLLANIQLFIDSKNLSRILFMNELYKMAIDVQGVIFDFGTRWGPNAAQFCALRSIYEPFNRHKKIVAFDTFEGFPSVDSEDGNSDLMVPGQLELPKDYELYLEKLLTLHESLNPLSHIKKFEILKGDATKTLPDYLNRNPQTIIALAYFDFDIYKPTKVCLDMIADRLTKGSVLGFDELNDPDSPGETTALMQAFGLRNIKLRRYRYASRVSYFVVD
jgi:hypothetical protein